MLFILYMVIYSKQLIVNILFSGTYKVLFDLYPK